MYFLLFANNIWLTVDDAFILFTVKFIEFMDLLKILEECLFSQGMGSGK